MNDACVIDNTTSPVTSYISDKGNHITIRHLILPPEERAKRMEEIKQAAIRLVLETEKAKQRKAQKIK